MSQTQGYNVICNILRNTFLSPPFFLGYLSVQDTFGVPSSVDQHVIFHTTGEEASRLYVKKTIVVGNVSKYSTIMFLSLLLDLVNLSRNLSALCVTTCFRAIDNMSHIIIARIPHSFLYAEKSHQVDSYCHHINIHIFSGTCTVAGPAQKTEALYT